MTVQIRTIVLFVLSKSTTRTIMRRKTNQGSGTIQPFPIHHCVLLIDSDGIYNTQTMFLAVGFQIVKSVISNGSEQRRTPRDRKTVYLIRLGDENV